jgi:hypothetical protein
MMQTLQMVMRPVIEVIDEAMVVWYLVEYRSNYMEFLDVEVPTLSNRVASRG